METNKDTVKRKMRFSLVAKILCMSMIPIFIVSLVLIIVGIRAIQSGMRQEVISKLRVQINNTLAFVDSKDSGNYTLASTGHLYKGGYDITGNESHIDMLVEGNDIEITFFYDKTRRATSIYDVNTNERILGTDASDVVYNTVVRDGKDYESYSVKINNKEYYAVYQPLTNSDGTVVGMIFAGEPSTSVRKLISEKTSYLLFVAIVIAIISAISVIICVGVIRKAIVSTNEVIATLSEGKLSVRVDERLIKRSDEFGDMARGVDMLQKQMYSVMSKVNSAAQVLMDAGRDLSGMASQTSATADEIGHAVEDISKGAISQAEEIENVSSDIDDMGRVIEKIVSSVAVLDDTSDDMKDAGERSTRIIKELSVSSDRTMDAIERISNQVHATNESANRIGQAIELITSIAEETNLLSLNASIEAARAGEQGRGFAVVANQISKLAEQSNEAAQNVAKIIDNLVKDSEKTVEVMNEVQVIVNDQQDKFNKTRKEFSNVSDGINSSREETMGIKSQTTVCDAARIKVVDVISNLSAISQENAASTEQTTASMQELNATINLLSDAADNLTELSNTLEEEIKFFKI